MTNFFSGLGLAAGVSLLAGPLASASTLPTIDNFTAGKTVLVLNGTTQTSDFEKTFQGKGKGILGGIRQTNFLVPLAGNPFHLNAQLDIAHATATAPAAMTISSGFGMSVRGELSWGNSVTSPLNVSLSAYDRFRVHFLALDGDQNIVMETFSAAGDGEWGCALASSPYRPVVVDMPFANAPGADLSKVTEIGLVSQGGAYGYDTAITLIEVVKAGTPPADVTCPPITNAVGAQRKR
jgi:hypothetical protein